MTKQSEYVEIGDWRLETSDLNAEEFELAPEFSVRHSLFEIQYS